MKRLRRASRQRPDRSRARRLPVRAAALAAVLVPAGALLAIPATAQVVSQPQRQGLNAVIADGPPPLNILEEVPEPSSQFDYSPMWDVHLATWTSAAIAAGLNVRQTDFSAVLQQVTDGNVTGFPAGAAFGPSGFIVNCPVVSLDVNPEG
jgi:hypothetical protein